MLPRLAGRFFGALSSSENDSDGGSESRGLMNRAGPRDYRTAFTAPPSSPATGRVVTSISHYGSVLQQPTENEGVDQHIGDAEDSEQEEDYHEVDHEESMRDLRRRLFQRLARNEEVNHVENVGDSELGENDNEDATALHGEDEEAVAVLTRRLRCLFAVITWPIVPLGTIVALSFFWLLYAAFWAELGQSCSHPLHGYAILSLLLILYIPNHAKVRSRFFNYVRERDGYQRPVAVRRYDQCFHTLSLLYVYGGITLVQTCREDLQQESAADAATHGLNTCAATCPHLYRATWVYVSTVELFTISLILPILFLPCIYLWFLRQATVDAEALAILQERLREDDLLFRSGGVTSDEILERLERVKLVQVITGGDDSVAPSSSRVFVIPVDCRDLSQAKEVSGVRSCCICMSDFEFQVVEATSDDLEAGQVIISNSDVEEEGGGSESTNVSDSEIIVRTRVCGHLFHANCIGSWVGGRWHRSETGNDGSSSPRRRARRTTCPLCRSDLRPM